MTKAQPTPPSDLPLGSDPSRSRAPLLFWIVLYAIFMILLVWMALFYPAPR